MNRRRLIVAMKLTTECRERLTWIIAKLTHPGDHVVAVHVVQSSSARTSEKELDTETRQELDYTFEGVLGVYQSLCNLKQIKLDIKVVVGASIKEALVDTAKLEDATKLILGTSKFLPTGFSTSMAKFCLKRLPPSCEVTVVDRGKVIFQKEGTRKHPEDKNSGTSSPSRSFVSETTTSESDKSSPDSPVSVLQPNDNKTNKRLPSVSVKALNSASRSLSCPQQRTSTTSSDKIPQRASTSSASTSSTDETRSASSGEENDENTGWPLKAFPVPTTPSRKLSVVNWAMQLPDRSPNGNSPAYGRSSVSTCRSSNDNSSPSYGRSSVSTCTSEYDKVAPRQETCQNRRRHSFQELCSFEGRPMTEEAVPPEKEVAELALSDKLHVLDTILPRKFTVEELEAATCGFSENNFIGKGGYSKVYRGVLNGQEIAVKCLNEVTPSMVLEELMTEVEILSTLRHRYIITILGYCVEGQRRMLVYNFARNGNLEQSLHDVNSSEVLLDWAARHRIAVGASEALDYLHDGSPRSVIHRDVKSSNILLSADFDPQVSDFGLAKWAPSSDTHIKCNGVFGTFGYLAPEYFKFGIVNEKTDVYSFGVVLLELITGRRPIDTSRAKGQENLVIWGRPLLEDEDMDSLVDPKLEGRYDKVQMRHMILAAALCLRQSPQFRPSMHKISELLKDGLKEEESMSSWASRELNLSRELDEDYFKDIYASSSADASIHLALAMAGVDDFHSIVSKQ